MRGRQVHMDFHTSKYIDNIGGKFNAQEFAQTLKDADVDSVTCFARCHHGYVYYDSKKFPERIHPHLKNVNLLKEQIEACHKVGIKVPIYLTVQWDYYTGNTHPEWYCRDEEDNILESKQPTKGFYQFLCLNSPYRDFLKEQVKEICEMFKPVDGLFFDILFPVPCACPACRKKMKEQGYNWTNKEERIKYSNEMLDEFKIEMSNLIREYDKNCTIFYNSSHVGPFIKPSAEAYTHFELESLPSGGWGYMHFPITMRYARKLGKECLGMTGKFHTYWGDFHSYKNQAALEFECFQMLALNAKCSIGDQLEPNGKISKPTYQLIGNVYSSVRAKEPWCEGAEAVTEIALFTPEEYVPGNLHPAIIGATRMLQESGYQFDIIDSKMDFNNYKVLILPNCITVQDKFKTKLENYVDNGGAVIASYQSGMDSLKLKFNTDLLGVEYVGKAPYHPDFIVPKGEIGKGLYETEYVMYSKGLEVKEKNNAEVLNRATVPYFNRGGEYFCSHQHTPSSGKEAYPAIVKNGRSIYFAHPIFEQYNKNASIWCKKLFINALKMFIKAPLIKHNAPSTATITLNKQVQQNRYIVHLLHYIPEKRSEDIFTIEDKIPLYNINLSIKLPQQDQQIKSVQLVPQEQTLDYKTEGNYITLTVPKVNGHQMISINFK